MPGAGAGRIAGLIPARAGNTISHASPGSSMWAHPRSRGEHGKVSRLTIIAAGSSPLARGTRGGVMRWRDTVGLIPARAGNTPAISSWVSQIWAHPRSRGEHSVVCKSPWTSKGSSPLARGTPVLGGSTETVPGLIPARAGNTWELITRNFSLRAHPRSRGEHLIQSVRRERRPGSSPLARGTRSISRPARS